MQWWLYSWMVKNGSTCVISKAGTRDPRCKFRSHRMLISGVYSDILSDLNYYYCIIYIIIYQIISYIIIYLYHLCKSYWKPHPKKVYQVHLGSLGYLGIWPRSQDDPKSLWPCQWASSLYRISLRTKTRDGLLCRRSMWRAELSACSKTMWCSRNIHQGSFFKSGFHLGFQQILRLSVSPRNWFPVAQKMLGMGPTNHAVWVGMAKSLSKLTWRHLMMQTVQLEACWRIYGVRSKSMNITYIIET
jgi:hypothetical protein